MKYCQQCGVLYSGELPACPKCNALLTDYDPPPGPEADKSVRTRQWIGICLGIPALIAFLYLMAWLFLRLSGQA